MMLTDKSSINGADIVTFVLVWILMDQTSVTSHSQRCINDQVLLLFSVSPSSAAADCSDDILIINHHALISQYTEATE